MSKDHTVEDTTATIQRLANRPDNGNRINYSLRRRLEDLAKAKLEQASS